MVVQKNKFEGQTNNSDQVTVKSDSIAPILQRLTNIPYKRPLSKQARALEARANI